MTKTYHSIKTDVVELVENVVYAIYYIACDFFSFILFYKILDFSKIK